MCAYRQHAQVGFRHGFDRVAHEIEDDLLYLDAISQDDRRQAVEFQGDADAGLPCPDQRQSERFRPANTWCSGASASS
jgi:hypothetical protein